MLKIPYQKLRLSSKGNLNLNTNSISNNNSTYSTNSTIYRISRRVLQGIPVLSIFAFLGIMSLSFNPGLQGLVKQFFAVPTCSAAPNCEVSSGCPDGYEYQGEPICGCVPIVTTNPDTSVDASASLTIDNNVIKDNITAVRGDMAYASHNIKVSANDVASYKLTITGPTNLTAPAGGATISGAGGKTGSAMSANTWGYGWGSSNATEANLTYNSFTGAAQTLSSGNAKSDHTISLDNKLVFAAKFSNDAGEGHYTASVNLNLTVTPRALSALEKISSMQEMTTSVCANAAVGDTNTLVDLRDGNSYTIRKHEDNKCWMTQNLRIRDKTLTPTDSDVTSNFTIPTSDIYSFGTSYNTNSVYYANDLTYGAYYSWYTATAGAGTNSVSSGDVTPSICPKGWRLPSQSDYSSLATAIGAGNNAAGSTLFRNTTYKFQYAGSVANGSLNGTGSSGRYWSRTASSSNNAYILYLVSSNAGPGDYDAKYRGFSVRCVAYSS